MSINFSYLLYLLPDTVIGEWFTLAGLVYIKKEVIIKISLLISQLWYRLLRRKYA